jgi:hypothetical protein
MLTVQRAAPSHRLNHAGDDSRRTPNNGIGPEFIWRSVHRSRPVEPLPAIPIPRACCMGRGETGCTKVAVNTVRVVQRADANRWHCSIRHAVADPTAPGRVGAELPRLLLAPTRSLRGWVASRRESMPLLCPSCGGRPPIAGRAGVGLPVSSGAGAPSPQGASRVVVLDILAEALDMGVLAPVIDHGLRAARWRHVIRIAIVVDRLGKSALAVDASLPTGARC